MGAGVAPPVGIAGGPPPHPNNWGGGLRPQGFSANNRAAGATKSPNAR
ncbi:hypothetical protein ACVWY1_005104, partial [Pseudomonas sp. TE6288]